MVTVFICVDDDVAKEIAKKYMGPGKVPYMNMDDSFVYQDVVEAIAGLEKKVDGPEDSADTEEKTLIEQGWTPVAMTEECLKPSENEFMVVVAYTKTENDKQHIQTSMDTFTKKELKEIIRKYKVQLLPETQFNKKYHV